MKYLYDKFVKMLVKRHSDINSTDILPAICSQQQDAINAWTMTASLKRLANSGFNVSSILDVGASDGKWTKDALTIFPNAQYLLFEPLEERRRELQLLKGSYANIDFELAAVGSELGEVSFIVTEDLDGSRAILNETHNNVYRNVPLITIDYALEKKHLPPPYILKLDVHGYELPILMGAIKTLKQTRIAIIEAYNFHITADSPTFSELVLYMDKSGFYCIDVADPLRMTTEGFEWQVDLFFARKNDPIFDNKTLRF